MTTASKQSVKETIASAISQNQISVQAANVILEDIDDVALAGANGVDIDDIDSEEVTLVACVIDASYSMEPFQKDVIEAYNDSFLKALAGAQNADSILVETWIFSSHRGSGNDRCRLVHGYRPVNECDPLNESIYAPDGGTPLNEAVHKALTGMVAYGQTLRDGGTRTKCIVVVLSDGEENTSPHSLTNAKIAMLSKDLLKQEIYILSYAYFGNEAEGDDYASRIGFPSQHRLTAGQEKSEIRRMFGTVSASVISASQAAVSAKGLSANAFFTM